MEAKPRKRRKSERIKDMMRDLRRKDRNLGLDFGGVWRSRGDGGRGVAWCWWWWCGMGAGVFGIFWWKWGKKSNRRIGIDGFNLDRERGERR